MIEQARARLHGIRDKLLSEVDFGVGNVTALTEKQAVYNKVIVIRVIINLGNWERQLKGLRECTRALKPTGLLLLSEATLQGWHRMNSFRREWGLSDIQTPPFDNYLDEHEVIAALSSEMELVKLVDFSSTYYVGTRVIKPLIIKALATSIDVANPDMEWNRWFAQLPSVDDYGVQKLFVFRKR